MRNTCTHCCCHQCDHWYWHSILCYTIGSLENWEATKCAFQLCTCQITKRNMPLKMSNKGIGPTTKVQKLDCPDDPEALIWTCALWECSKLIVLTKFKLGFAEKLVLTL